jgi:lysyl-tRNA synthetase class 2
LINRQQNIAQTLVLRAKIFQAVRDFFTSQQFLEVDTPIRIPAPAPEPFIAALPSGNWYLQTSPELCMKRLLAAGHSKIFQICKCFRKEERGNRHLEEFTMLEWYELGATYHDLMAHCENLFQFIKDRLLFENGLIYKGHYIDISPPWEKLSVTDAFIRYSSLPMQEAIISDQFDEIIAFDIEPNLGLNKPIFLYDYPAKTCPLASPRPHQPNLAQRFELYMGGLELCNGFTELTDPDEQRRRFAQELTRRENTGEAVYPMPEKFLDDLHLMPEAAGNALGLDRLVMLFANAASIDEVVAFTPEEL